LDISQHPQGRERLKELVNSLNGSEFIIVAISYKQSERFLQSIFKERAFADKSDIERFLEDPIPIKEFLDPPPEPVADENGLLPCPFCGGTNIDMYQIGNEWTKKRAYEIKCKTFGCCTTRKVGVITMSLQWAKEVRKMHLKHDPAHLKNLLK